MSKLLIVGYLLFMFIQHAVAQPFSQWGNLQAGKYHVGFKTQVNTDYTRTYGSSARPVQMYIWYPARSTNRDNAIYETYFSDIGYDWGRDKNISDSLSRMLMKEFRTGALNPSFSGSIGDSQFAKILNTTIPVTRDAKPAFGRFPLLLHISSNGALHQSVMLEYLASYGYVVVSMSMYGSSPAFYGRGEAGPMGLHAMTEDLAFAISQSRSLDFVDTNKTAVIGMMAQAGISLQMKEELVDAVVCLDCFPNNQMMKSLPYYDPRRIRLKILQIVNNSFGNANRFLLDSLIYAERFEVVVPGLQHPDFYPYPRIVSPVKAKDETRYDMILHYSRLFLDYAFSGAATDQIHSTQVIRYKAARLIPTEAEFLNWLRYGQMDEVRKAWNEYGKQLTNQDNFFSVVLFLARDKSTFAKESFEMYSSAYPNDPRLKMILQFF